MDETNKRSFDTTLRPISGRDVAASLGPRPIAVIGARNGDEICFATVAWATPISHTPPMVAFALRGKSRTFQLARKSGRFSISVPDARLADAVNACGNTSGNAVDKSALVEWALAPGSGEPPLSAQLAAAQPDGSDGEPLPGADPAGTRGADSPALQADAEALPVLASALTAFSCRVESIAEAGDHMLVTGTVERAWSRAGKDARGRIDPTDALLCIQHDLFATLKR